ncbi:MAG TPA: hypothetical protein EYO50_09865 [Candidatus Marinimicrobia bacterium]|jgi:hypothetical protein|nr:hypothetical protein [Candidatus Neomarinimicrobiota bacterium]
MIKPVSTQSKVDKKLVEVEELYIKINDTQSELKEVQTLIQEETYITKGKRIYIIRGKEYTKGKVQYRGKMRWFHLGKTEILSETTDDELKSIVREKFYKSLITKPPKPTQVSIPLMMTKKMKVQLGELGYTENQIKNMTPQQGWDNIKKGKKK